MRDTVKTRKVGESLVVTLTKPLALEAGISEGDPVVLETLNSGRILIRKETAPMNPTQFLELELDILKKQKYTLQTEAAYMVHQHNNSMPSHHPGIEDSLIMEGEMRSHDWAIAKLDVEIAQKRLELFTAGGNLDTD